MATAPKAEYEVKKVRKKDGSFAETKYRIDASFIPAAVNEICDKFIINYCIANNEEEWLFNELNATETATANKDRKVTAVVNGIKQKNYNVKAGESYEQPKSFVSLRSDFANKFFPDIVKGSSTKTSPLDEFMKAYKEKNKIR